MNYLKIIEVASACEVKRIQINQCEAALGVKPGDDTWIYLHGRIAELDKEKGKLENQLRKLIEQ